jgi:hypothetical protein
MCVSICTPAHATPYHAKGEQINKINVLLAIKEYLKWQRLKINNFSVLRVIDHSFGLRKLKYNTRRQKMTCTNPNSAFIFVASDVFLHALI